MKQVKPTPLVSVEGLTKVESQRGNVKVTKYYDNSGRLVLYQNNKGYWSQHLYTHVDGKILHVYSNSRDNKYSEILSETGRLLSRTEQNGTVWDVIVDTSHQVLYSAERGVFLYAGQHMLPHELVRTLEEQSRAGAAICPSVLRAVRKHLRASKPWWRRFLDILLGIGHVR